MHASQLKTISLLDLICHPLSLGKTALQGNIYIPQLTCKSAFWQAFCMRQRHASTLFKNVSWRQILKSYTDFLKNKPAQLSLIKM